MARWADLRSGGACLLGLLALLSGCAIDRPLGRESIEPHFVSLYRELRASTAAAEARTTPEPVVTVSADAMPLSAFLRLLSDRTGVSVVAAANLDGEPVTLDVVDQPIGVVLGAVARRLGVQASRSGSSYFLGDLKPEDRGVMVRRVGGVDAADLRAALEAPLSTEGKLAVTPDGVAVVSDRVEVLARVAEVADALDAATPGEWVVQAYLVSLSSNLEADWGLDVTPTADLAASLGVAAEGLPSSQFAAQATLAAVLSATRTQGGASLVARPLVVVSDGGTGRVSDGQTVPIPRRAVLPESGLVQTVDVEFIDTGLIFDVQLREAADSTASVGLNVELSEVVGFVEEFPQLARRQLTTRARLRSGGVYLVGMLERDQRRQSVRSVTRSAESISEQTQDVFVWLTAIRVDGRGVQRASDG
jgi:hypothetical protein